MGSKGFFCAADDGPAGFSSTLIPARPANFSFILSPLKFFY